MKRVVSICLSMVLLILPISVGANAAYDDSRRYSFSYQSNEYELVNFDPTTVIDVSDNNNSTWPALPFFADTADSPHRFYSYLNDLQKQVYNKVKENPLSTSVTVTFNDIEADCTVVNGSLKLPDAVQNKLIAGVIGGVSAVCDDYPMIYWINGFSYNIPDITGYYNSDGTFHAYLNTLNIGFSIAAAYSSISEVTAKYNQMKSIVDSIDIKGNTRYEQVKYIHDFIAKRVVYDPNLGNVNENPTDHDPTSVFLEPYITVCEGYAESFKILCDKAEIPCIVVVGNASGGGHAWNYVKMDDNKWYAVDLTWDDQGDYGTFYDWFLVGSSSTNKYFHNSDNSDANVTFSQSHVATGKRYNTNLFSLTYPTLSFSSYLRMMLDVDSKSTVRKEKMRLYIPGNSTVGSQITVPYGYKSPEFNSSKTGSTLNIRNSQNVVTETYTVIMWGDVVADAAVNVSDYNKVKDTSVNKIDSLKEGTVQYEAGDLNGDGVIDAFDTALLDLQMSGK